MSATTNDAPLSTANRLRALAEKTGRDPFDLAEEEIERYKFSNRELRRERDVLRARLHKYLEIGVV